jgi:MoaA/NifB/PqqE/SkfB family radical SAM enzyme
MVARGGLNVLQAGTPLKQQCDSAILAITRRCPLRCRHCYEQFNLEETDTVPIARWKQVIQELQEIGVANIMLSGGEPMTRFEGVLELLEAGDKQRSDFHLHTSGQGVTPERVRLLKQAGLQAAAVGLEDVNPDRYDRLRQKTGAHATAIKALEIFNQAGIMTYVNLCATRQLIRSGELWDYFEMAKNLGVSFIQLLEPRPVGAFMYSNAGDLLEETDRETLRNFTLTGNRDKKYRDYPVIHDVAYVEHKDRMGCLMGGLSLLTIDAAGNVNPCVFVPVSFGNILQEDLQTIYQRMRIAIPRPVRKICPSLLLADLVRSKISSGSVPPIPFTAVESEWDKLLYSPKTT